LGWTLASLFWDGEGEEGHKGGFFGEEGGRRTGRMEEEEELMEWAMVAMCVSVNVSVSG